jgi:hypothetical protein
MKSKGSSYLSDSQFRSEFASSLNDCSQETDLWPVESLKRRNGGVDLKNSGSHRLRWVLLLSTLLIFFFAILIRD